MANFAIKKTTGEVVEVPDDFAAQIRAKGSPVFSSREEAEASLAPPADEEMPAGDERPRPVVRIPGVEVDLRSPAGVMRDAVTGADRATATSRSAEDITASPEWWALRSEATPTIAPLINEVATNGLNVDAVLTGIKASAAKVRDRLIERGTPPETATELATQIASDIESVFPFAGVARDAHQAGMAVSRESATPQEQIRILQAQNPELKVDTDENGNLSFVSPKDGRRYSTQPGISSSDITRIPANMTAGAAALLGGGSGGAVRKVATMAGKEALVQAGLEAGQAVQGDTDVGDAATNIALAGATSPVAGAAMKVGGAVARPVNRVVEKVSAPITAPIKAALSDQWERSTTKAVSTKVSDKLAEKWATFKARDGAIAALMQTAKEGTADDGVMTPDAQRALREVIRRTGTTFDEAFNMLDDLGPPTMLENLKSPKLRAAAREATQYDMGEKVGSRAAKEAQPLSPQQLEVGEGKMTREATEKWADLRSRADAVPALDAAIEAERRTAADLANSNRFDTALKEGADLVDALPAPPTAAATRARDGAEDALRRADDMGRQRASTFADEGALLDASTPEAAAKVAKDLDKLLDVPQRNRKRDREVISRLPLVKDAIARQEMAGRYVRERLLPSPTTTAKEFRENIKYIFDDADTAKTLFGGAVPVGDQWARVTPDAARTVLDGLGAALAKTEKNVAEEAATSAGRKTADVVGSPTAGRLRLAAVTLLGGGPGGLIAAATQRQNLKRVITANDAKSVALIFNSRAFQELMRSLQAQEGRAATKAVATYTSGLPDTTAGKIVASVLDSYLRSEESENLNSGG